MFWLVAVLVGVSLLGGRVVAASPCTLLVGYSQTQAMVERGGFASRVSSPSSWRYMVNPGGSGGNVRQYADPSFYPYANGWAAWGSSCDPARVVFHITWDSYTDDAASIASVIPQAVALIKSRWAPNASSVSLLTAVGGPGGVRCVWTGANPDPTAQPYVRAAYNRAALIAAAASLASSSSSYVAGPSPVLAACAYFEDWVGHWLRNGWEDVNGQSAAVASQVANFYNAVDSGAPAPTPTPTPTPAPTGSCVITWGGVVRETRITTEAACAIR